MEKKLEAIIINSIKELYKDTTIDFDSVNFLIEMKKENEFGNYSANVAFALSKLLDKSPKQIAEEIRGEIVKKPQKFIEKIEVAGNGFINFFLTKEYLTELFFGDGLLKNDIGNNEKIIIEYSSPNVAKPMHAGHLRATILGDFLANLYKFVGYNVIRWNHIGDWGTQFGKLIVAYKLWGNKSDVENEPIKQLLKLYIKFHEEAEVDKTLNDKARNEFKKLENNNSENKKLLKWFLKESLKEFNSIYNKLSISFDVVLGESNYIKIAKDVLNKLEKYKISSKSEGAIVVNLEDKDLGVALVEKGDGTTLYLTRDLALIFYRQKKYHPDKILYVVGNEQNLHFKQLNAIKDKINSNLDKKHKLPEFEHISFGFVLGPDGKKLSTRDGKVIQASDIIDRSLKSISEIVDKKQQDLQKKDKNKIIKIVGIGAVRYSMLKENRTSNIKLNLDTELSSKGNSAPYLQYTYARLRGIIKKSKRRKNFDFQRFENEDINLMKYAILFPNIITACVKDCSSHHLAEYMFGLANKINSFYENNNIINDDNIDRKNARLAMILRLTEILKTGFVIMGIDVLENI